MNDRQEKVLTSFIQLIGECRTDCIQIAQLIDDHLGVCPDDLNLSNVGDAEQLKRHLRKIIEIFSDKIPKNNTEINFQDYLPRKSGAFIGPIN